MYLGDPKLRPLLDEVDRRDAVVFVHPTTAPCCFHHSSDSNITGTAPLSDQNETAVGKRRKQAGEEQHETAGEQYAASSSLASVYRAPLFEFFFDSGRTFLDLLTSGTILRFPRIRWIVSHCGGVLPSLIDRMWVSLRFHRPPPLYPIPEIEKVPARVLWCSIHLYILLLL